MNNKEDLLLREKIESVGTLQGGIVYGKEDAWDKLQARMDKKPVRVLPWRSMMAAAAILLLVAGITLYHFMQPANIVKQEYTKQHIQPLHTPTGDGQTSPAPATPITTTAKPDEVKAVAKQPAPPALTPVAVHLNTDVAITQNTPAPLIPLTDLTLPAAKPKMKVLHINELDNPVAMQQETIAMNDDQWTPAAANGGKMRTLHINDVKRQDEEDRLIPKPTRPSIGNITFFKKPSPYQMDMKSEPQDRSHGLFKINTGTQN